MEWVIFHHIVGFNKFYIYLHKCDDNSTEIIQLLQRYFDIKCFTIPDDTWRPQLASYQHAYQAFGHETDWIAFIDGDEFLFPTKENSLTAVLDRYSYEKMSALAVYWSCFGSSGHLYEPAGLIIENFQYRAPTNFPDNSHVKSIVRGHQGMHFQPGPNAHIFNTIYGTKDENLRDIDAGHMPELNPTYTHLRINHYVCQSYQFFKEFKQNSGAADAGPMAIRPDDWWPRYNRNDEHDQEILRFSDAVKQTMTQII